MTGQPSRKPGRFRHSIGCISSFAVLVAGSALAGPLPIVQRDAPLPVTALNSEQLNKLPANRDLLTILNYHNQLRAEVGSPPLRWNADLAAGAAAYGPSLSQGGSLQHASREGRKAIRENLSQSPRGAFSPLAMVQRWGNEQRNFRPGKFPNVTVDGNVDSVLHYSQMIWPTTTDVGCAHHADARFDWLICRYSPPGNKDGVAIGRGLTQLAQTEPGGLCTSPRGVTIPCQNAPGGVPEGPPGGTIDNDGGGDKDSGAKEEVACAVDVNVHRPISVAPDEPVVPEAEELAPGATTLRNDDSDWHLGGEGGAGELPIISLPTDIDQKGNANENDLVKVVAINPGHTNVYLFAFPTDAEADRKLKTQVKPIDGGRHANEQELAYFQAAAKTGRYAPPGLPLLIPTGATTLWVEGMLGGRYRMVIGKLADLVAPADVRYDVGTGAAYVSQGDKGKSPFHCEDQATVTAAVVDIFQRNTNDNSERRTAFDVYWGGRPHFRAEVWPGGNFYRWGVKYRLGAEEREMPGKAATGRVASMDEDEQDVLDDRWAKEEGVEASDAGYADGNFTEKGKIQDGGFQIHTLPGVAPGDIPDVNRDLADRYPDRVTLGYIVNNQPLVRAEYLEVILPQVRQPVAPTGPVAGKDEKGRSSTRRVASDVQYTIVDAFDREIKAKRVDDYLHLYGAGIKAWEALEQQPDRVFESGPTLDGQGRLVPDQFNDFAWVMQAGAIPIRLGTAQRSQAEVHANRMIDGTFEDTLIFTAPPNRNERETFWRVFTGRTQTTHEQDIQFINQALVRSDNIRRQQNLGDVQREDQARIVNSNVLTIQQDAILQLRVGAQRYDLMVFRRNTLTVFAPYFFDSTAYPGDKSDPVFRYHIQFTPGARASELVRVNHRRP